MIVLLLALLIIAFLMIRAAIPIVLVLALLVIGIFAVCTIFKDKVDQNGNTIIRDYERTMGIGCVFLVTGGILWYDSMDGYRGLLSGALILGGPRPGAIALVFIGVVIIIYGVITRMRE